MTTPPGGSKRAEVSEVIDLDAASTVSVPEDFPTTTEKIVKGTMGMVNLGNTCYLGAVLVGLLHVGKSFWGSLKKANPELHSDSSVSKGDWLRILTELHDHAWSGKKQAFEPRDCWLTLRTSSASYEFTSGLQHDAQEALECILDGLHHSLPAGQQSKKRLQKKDAPWNKYLCEQKSTIVPEAFHGYIKSTLECAIQGCKSLNDKFEPYVSWPVPLLRKIELIVLCETRPTQDQPMTRRFIWVERNASADEVREVIMQRFGKKNQHVILLTMSGAEVPAKDVPKMCVAAFGERGKNFGLVFKGDTQEHGLTDRPLDIFGYSFTLMEAGVDKAECPGDAYAEAVMKKSLERRCTTLYETTYTYDILSCTVVDAETKWYVAKVKTTECVELPVCENADAHLTLETCMEQFFQKETLGEGDMVLCEKCNQKSRATKTFQPEHLPDILVIQLKRFVHCPIRLIGQKVKDPVIFQEELDMPILRHRYRLKAVVFHHGYGLSSGHYTCTAQVGGDGEWYAFDDSTVTKTNLEDDRTSETKSAYLLFYEKSQGEEQPPKRQRRKS
jgi:ubiquitin C-terminal hydrolase